MRYRIPKLEFPKKRFVLCWFVYPRVIPTGQWRF